ncbi:LuxR C-terminal-related transcriptional regulator [Nesterenkonia sp. AY15]|uniref:helix-turn-helix transcriptional regulator n=1 Tax=Nesterenkonia sp. AY15 TaxID=2901139 RepID=UPI001F4CADC3|nr:LuxR C-terminal-related transcriptional regulator [Nesterenkonia sp. AY15]
MNATAARVAMGRDPERAKVLRAIYSTLAGRSAVCFLEGTIGSGKSTLAGEARAWAASAGLTVMAVSDLTPDAEVGEALQQHGPGPYCLVADDLHLVEPGIQASLEQLIDHGALTLNAGPPVLIIATASPTTDPLTRRLAKMAAQTGTRITLRGITEHELDKLLRQHGHRLAEKSLAVVHARAAGNRGIALRLAGAGLTSDAMARSAIPQSFLQPELEQMAPCLRTFLEVLALDGGDSSTGQTAEVAALALEAATRTVTAALDVDSLVDALNPILTGNGREVRLHDQAWREATVALIEPARRRQLHDLLARRTSGLAQARHLSAASPDGDPELGDTLESEGIRALEAGDYSSSAEYLALAMGVSRGPERNRRMVSSCLTVGIAENPGGMASLFTEVGLLEDPALAAFFHAGLAFFTGRLAEARRLLLTQLRNPWSNKSLDDLTHWRMLILLCSVEIAAADARAAQAAVAAAQSLEVEPATPIDRALSRVLVMHEVYALWNSGAVEESITRLNAFLIEAADTAEHTDALYFRARAHFYAGHTTAALDDLERAEEGRHRRVVPAAAQRGMAEQAMMEFQLGRWTDAILRAERVIAMARTTHDWRGLASSHAVLAMAAVAHADETAAAEHADWLSHHVTTSSALPLYNVMTAMAWTARMAGDQERALCVIADFRGSKLSTWTERVGLIGWRALEIEALLDLENPTRARLAEAERLLATFSQKVAAHPALPLPYGHPQALRAKLAAQRGDLMTAVADYRSAIWLTADFPHTKARLHHSLGVVHRERGEHTEADDQLEAARDIFAQLGAAPELTAVKGRLLSVAGRYASLTPRERDIAHLISQGRTNRQISESLFVSQKTVEYHVANLLPKLRMDSRRELWTAAAVTSQRTSPPEQTPGFAPGVRA